MATKKNSKTKIVEQLLKDSATYEVSIQKKLKQYFKKGISAVPITAAAGEAYMKSYRGRKQKNFALKLDRAAIAYLYLHAFDNGSERDLAIGFANYDTKYLKTPNEPRKSDPSWNPKRKGELSVMLGYYDTDKGIVPFKADYVNSGATTVADLYDDWHTQWPKGNRVKRKLRRPSSKKK